MQLIDKTFLLFVFFTLNINSYAGPQIHPNSDIDMTIFDNALQYTPVSNISRKYRSSQGIPQLQMIKSAEKSLIIQVYEMKSKLIQQEIINALYRGVQVQLLVEPDPVGNACDAFSVKNKTSNVNCEEGQQFIDDFNKAIETSKLLYPKSKVKLSGIKYFNKNFCYDAKNKKKINNCYMHGKMIIKDAEEVLVSTGNFNDTSFCMEEFRRTNKCRRDFSLIMHSADTAENFKNIFEIDYKFGVPCDLPPENPSANRVPSVSEELCLKSQVRPKDIPLSVEFLNLSKIMKKKSSELEITLSPLSEDRIVEFIDSAEKRIQIQAQYLKVPSWHFALLRALDRGVKVDITLASLCYFYGKGGPSISYNNYYSPDGLFHKFINPLIFHKSQSADLRFFIQGVPFPKQGIGGYLHSKVIIIDEKNAWIGSTNGSELSNSYNREFGVLFSNPKIIKQLVNVLNQDQKRSWTLEQHVPNPNNPPSVYPEGSCKILTK